VERDTFHLVSQVDLPSAVAVLIEAQLNYAAVQVDADSQLAEAQRRRETAMRRVAGLGLSHRRIGELTGLSHTRVNQILGTGVKRPPDDIHFPPGFLAPPTTVPLAALRVIGEHGPRAWRVGEIAHELDTRDWPMHDLERVLVDLVIEGILLSVDGGYFTLHGYGDPSQTPPVPAAV
jgi:hypothetical protein